MLEEQPDPKKVFKAIPYEEMKLALQEWLAPEDSEEEGDIVSEPAEDFDSDIKAEPKSNYSLSAKPIVKKSKAEAFDDLFEEDDDLPF